MEIDGRVHAARRGEGDVGVVEDEFAAVVEDDSSPSLLFAIRQGGALRGSHVEGDVVEGERRGLAALENIHAALVGGDGMVITIDRKGLARDAEAPLGHRVALEIDGVPVLGGVEGGVQGRVAGIADLGNGVGDRRLRTCGGLIVSSILRRRRDGRSSDDIRVSLRLIGGLGGRI